MMLFPMMLANAVSPFCKKWVKSVGAGVMSVKSPSAPFHRMTAIYGVEELTEKTISYPVLECAEREDRNRISDSLNPLIGAPEE
jgi:hypothetical protein